MRLVGRILVIAASAVIPAVVVLIGCGVDDPGYPGLPNEVPNGRGYTMGGAQGASSSTGTGVAAMSICDCAATLTGDPGACTVCGQKTETDVCQTASTACQNDPTCTTAIACAASCAGDSTCLVACINSSPTYQAQLNCECTACLSVCGQTVPIACDLDGGSNG